MPTYAYQCDQCGHAFDAVQKFSDAPLTDCPTCGGRVRRVIQPAPVIFKGSGWYITDSRGGANGKADAAEKGDGKADAKTDAAEPAAKGEAAADKADKPAKPDAKAGAEKPAKAAKTPAAAD